MNDAERKAKLREIGRLMESDKFTAGLGLEYSPPLEHGEGGELAIRPDIWVVPKEEENPVAWALRFLSRVGKRIYESVVQSGRDFPYIRVSGGQ